MYIKQKNNVIFRNYDSFGYITDNRNFGYKLTNNIESYIGDKIVSETGAVFLSVLDKKPQTLEELTNKINQIFTDIDVDIIRNDAVDFYHTLEQEGFVVSGETLAECESKDKRFSYKAIETNLPNKDSDSPKSHSKKDTQDFFEDYFKGKPQLTNLHIEITSKCNERCIHCYIPHNNKINHIQPELFYDILNQCKELKLLHLTLSGGEPMLHKDFCNFLKKCREYDFSVNVLSNLTLLDDDIIKELKENPLLGVQVSLYSMNPDIHDEITQRKGSFEKTKKGILRLIENDIPLQISCPILKQNKGCYNDVKKWAAKYKVHAGEDFVIIGGYDHTTNNLNSRLSIDEVKELIREKAANNSKYTEQIKIEAEKKKDSTPEDFVCSVCNSSICITENGNVYPCAGWQSCILGNVKETTLSDIWNNSAKVQYLRNLRKRDFPQCVQCPDKDFCTMCMVRNANENPKGDPLIINKFFCDFAKINRELVLERKKKQ